MAAGSALDWLDRRAWLHPLIGANATAIILAATLTWLDIAVLGGSEANPQTAALIGLIGLKAALLTNMATRLTIYVSMPWIASAAFPAQNRIATIISVLILAALAAGVFLNGMDALGDVIVVLADALT